MIIAVKEPGRRAVERLGEGDEFGDVAVTHVCASDVHTIADILAGLSVTPRSVASSALSRRWVQPRALRASRVRG